MNFALQYREFNNWNNTVLTGESTFLTGSPHQKNVWRQNGTRYEEQNIQLIENSGRSTVSVWGACLGRALGPYIGCTEILIVFNIWILWKTWLFLLFKNYILMEIIILFKIGLLFTPQ